MKPILVTGGALGLGASICTQLAQDGHAIVIHYRASEQQARLVAEKCRSFGVQADVIQGDFSNPERVCKFLSEYSDRFSDTKGLVNNVGTYTMAPIFETPHEAWREQMQTNFFTPVQLIDGLVGQLRENSGVIVNIGVSGLNPARAKTATTAHSCTKAALWFYTRSLAKELASYHVRVNMVSPGYLENTSDRVDLRKIPMGRTGDVAEVARVIAFLFRDESAYITGQDIEIAGGFLL